MKVMKGKPQKNRAYQLSEAAFRIFFSILRKHLHKFINKSVTNLKRKPTSSMTKYLKNRESVTLVLPSTVF
jgi:hypothetical protein